MREVDLIRHFYESAVRSGFPYAADIPDTTARIKVVDDSGCHGDGKNLLFLTLSVVEGRLSRPRYECEYCDIMMYVTAELVCQLIDQRPVAELGMIRDAEITAALGGPSRKIIRQVNMALRMLIEALT